MVRFIGFRRENMNIKLLDKYIELCNLWNKPVTWEGLRLFKAAFK